jgi:hypothetical protein
MITSSFTPLATLRPALLALGVFVLSACNTTAHSAHATPGTDSLVGRWKVESVTTDNPSIQSLGVKTSGFADLQADGRGEFDFRAKLGPLSRVKKAGFSWRREGADLFVHEDQKDTGAVWKLLSAAGDRMEAEVPSGKQKLRMVFTRQP